MEADMSNYYTKDDMVAERFIMKNGNLIIEEASFSGFNNSLDHGLVPKGGIIMWSGSTVPTGWALCNGANGTPNLSGRFIVGINTSDADYNLIGKTGGQHTLTLTTNELPKHNHTITNVTNESQQHHHQPQISEKSAPHNHNSSLANDTSDNDHDHTFSVGFYDTNHNHNSVYTTTIHNHTGGSVGGTAIHGHFMDIGMLDDGSFSGTNRSGDYQEFGVAADTKNQNITERSFGQWSGAAGAHSHPIGSSGLNGASHSHGQDGKSEWGGATEHSHSLSVPTETSAHSHLFELSTNQPGDSQSSHNHNLDISNKLTTHTHDISIDNSGNSSDVDNRPSFYVLAFIMKVVD
jgi:microcystin-dependent protein